MALSSIMFYIPSGPRRSVMIWAFSLFRPPYYYIIQASYVLPNMISVTLAYSLIAKCPSRLKPLLKPLSPRHAPIIPHGNSAGHFRVKIAPFHRHDIKCWGTPYHQMLSASLFLVSSDRTVGGLWEHHCNSSFNNNRCRCHCVNTILLTIPADNNILQQARVHITIKLTSIGLARRLDRFRFPSVIGVSLTSACQALFPSQPDPTYTHVPFLPHLILLQNWPSPLPQISLTLLATRESTNAVWHYF